VHLVDGKFQTCYAVGSFPPLNIPTVLIILKVFPSVLCVELTNATVIQSNTWKIRTNRELEEMSKGENIVKWIKRQRMS
jgi:hypothetical protein